MPSSFDRPSPNQITVLMNHRQAVLFIPDLRLRIAVEFQLKHTKRCCKSLIEQEEPVKLRMDSAAIEKSPTRKRNRLQSTALSLLSFRGFFLTSVDVSNSGKPLLLSRERKNKRRMMGNTVRNGNRELFHPFSSFLLTTLHHLADYDALHFSCAAFPNAAARQCTTEILKQEYLTKLIPIEDWGNIENSISKDFDYWLYC
uniref:Uncharacterized protein n=1 Tax=Cucumis sativus TaxID=3659 RepID=A0A0A0LA48_CUCSA